MSILSAGSLLFKSGRSNRVHLVGTHLCLFKADLQLASYVRRSFIMASVVEMIVAVVLVLLSIAVVVGFIALCKSKSITYTHTYCSMLALLDLHIR